MGSQHDSFQHEANGTTTAVVCGKPSVANVQADACLRLVACFVLAPLSCEFKVEMLTLTAKFHHSHSSVYHIQQVSVSCASTHFGATRRRGRSIVVTMPQTKRLPEHTDFPNVELSITARKWFPVLCSHLHICHTGAAVSAFSALSTLPCRVAQSTSS